MNAKAEATKKTATDYHGCVQTVTYKTRTFLSVGHWHRTRGAAERCVKGHADCRVMTFPEYIAAKAEMEAR